MCIKIIKTEGSSEFNPTEPLEQQVIDAQAIVVNYDPKDPTIDNVDSLFNQLVRFYKNGISCNLDIKFNANNSLNGIKMERNFGKIREALDTNEVFKLLTKFHSEADSKLCEIAGMCLEKTNER